MIVLLASLPPDLWQDRILGDFCDGKTLSTLWLALATTRRGAAATSCSGGQAAESVGGSDEQEQQQHQQQLEGSTFRTTMVDVIIPKVAQRRVQALLTFMQNKSSKQEEDAPTTCANSSDTTAAVLVHEEAVAWIRSRFAMTRQQQQQQHDPSSLDHLRHRMRMISEQMALLDFLEESVYVISKHNAKHHFECPLWCGQIVLAMDMPNNNSDSDNNMNGITRIRVTSKIMITTPLQHPRCFQGLPGYNLLHNQRPCAIFQAEPYNILPVPPWGRIRPIQPITRKTGSTCANGIDDEDDVAALRTMAGRLQELNQVGIPTSTFSHQYSSGSQSAAIGSSANVLDIRIISKKQAQDRWQSRIQTNAATASTASATARPPIWQPRTAWLAHDENHVSDVGLLCCWQEEDDENDSFTTSTILNDDVYMTHVIDFLKARERLLAD